jgi:hypothetical protein
MTLRSSKAACIDFFQLSIKPGRPIQNAPSEILLFGAVYINASPQKYVEFAADFERRRKLSGHLRRHFSSVVLKLCNLSWYLGRCWWQRPFPFGN